MLRDCNSLDLVILLDWQWNSQRRELSSVSLAPWCRSPHTLHYYYTHTYTLTPERESVFVLLPLPTPTPLTAVQLKMCSSFQVHSLRFTLSFLPPHMWSLSGISGDFFKVRDVKTIILELSFSPPRSLKSASIYVAMFRSNIYAAECYTDAHMMVQAGALGLGKLCREGCVVSESNLPLVCPIWHATAR